jgi:hypothetical protein
VPTSNGKLYYGSTLIASGSGGDTFTGSQTFTTSGTFTVPNNITSILVHVRGGDGSEAAFTNSTDQNISGSSGGTTTVGTLSALGGLGGHFKSNAGGSSGCFAGGPSGGLSKVAWLSVSPGQQLPVTVGSGPGALAEILWGPHGRSQVFESSGTFTVPDGVTEVEVSVTGGRGQRIIGNYTSPTNTYGTAGTATSVDSLTAGGGSGGRSWMQNQYFVAWRNPLNGATASEVRTVTPGQQLTVTVGTGDGAHAVVSYFDPSIPDLGGTPNWQDSWPAGAAFPSDPNSADYTIPGTLVDTITASGTWTPPAGVSLVHVLVVGGGGAPTTSNDRGSAAGGEVVVFRNVPVSGDVPVTIGAQATASMFGALTARAGRSPISQSCTGGLGWGIESRGTGGSTNSLQNSNDPPATPGVDGVAVNGVYYGGGGGTVAYSGAFLPGGQGGGGDSTNNMQGVNGLGGGAGYKNGAFPNARGGSGRVMIWTEDI